jgi:hypothetical protein
MFNPIQIDILVAQRQAEILKSVQENQRLRMIVGPTPNLISNVLEQIRRRTDEVLKRRVYVKSLQSLAYCTAAAKGVTGLLEK